MMRDTRLSLAFVHPRIGRGGSEAFVMWGAEALKRDFKVTLLTTNRVDLDALNRFYGTALTPAELAVSVLPIPSGLRQIRGAAALRGAFFQRAVRSAVPDYDLMISAYNLCDFGIPGIHEIADFSWDEELRERSDPPPAGVDGLFHGIRWLRHSYLELCRKLAPPSGRNLFSGEDLVLANSEWTAARLRERHGAIANVLYPPVVGQFPEVPSERRSDDFACIGRISPEKRIERMIRIVGAVRGRGYDVRIRIIGLLDDSPYSRTIASLARRYSDWVLLEGERAGVEKLKILAQCRYAIHGREGEAFGIAVAEMVKAGCIVFGPIEGGPAEILDDDGLLYRDDDDAVEKIVAVMNSEALRTQLTLHLRHQATKFSAENFMDGLRTAVERFIQARGEAFPSDGFVRGVAAGERSA